MTNFVSSVASALKILKPSNSVSGRSIHKTSQHSFPWVSRPTGACKMCMMIKNLSK